MSVRTSVSVKPRLLAMKVSSRIKPGCTLATGLPSMIASRSNIELMPATRSAHITQEVGRVSAGKGRTLTRGDFDSDFSRSQKCAGFSYG